MNDKKCIIKSNKTGHRVLIQTNLSNYFKPSSIVNFENVKQANPLNKYRYIPFVYQYLHLSKIMSCLIVSKSFHVGYHLHIYDSFDDKRQVFDEIGPLNSIQYDYMTKMNLESMNLLRQMDVLSGTGTMCYSDVSVDDLAEVMFRNYNASMTKKQMRKIIQSEFNVTRKEMKKTDKFRKAIDELVEKLNIDNE